MAFSLVRDDGLVLSIMFRFGNEKPSIQLFILCYIFFTNLAIMKFCSFLVHVSSAVYTGTLCTANTF